MNDERGWRSTIAQLQDNATTESVYGEPIEAHGRTIVPVAKLWYGFGGGTGSGSSDGDAERAVETGAASEDSTPGGGDEGSAADDGSGATTGTASAPRPTPTSGAGGGAGLRAVPTGVVEIAEDGTRFVPASGRRKLAIVAAACLAIGFVAGWLQRWLP